MKQLFCTLLFAYVALACCAQKNMFTATFTPANSGSPITVQVAPPFFAFDNPHGYWVINPHNGGRHFNLQPDAGYGAADAAFITLSQQLDDYDFYSFGNSDTNSIMLTTGDYFISAPEFDLHSDNNKPLHVHINTFTASEISFTLSGTARYGTQKGNGEWLGNGIIQASGHFYREPKYAKSDVLPGCDCDATIYGAIYSKEDNVRSASACESALRNKVFDAMQKTLAPLFTTVNYQGSQHPMPAGAVNVTILPGCMDISVAPKTRPYCNSDYWHGWTVAFDAEKNNFNSDDAYGLRFIKMPKDEELKPANFNAQDFQKKMAFLVDSIAKLAKTGTITKIDTDKFYQSLQNPQLTKFNTDFKKTDADDNLTIKVLLNPIDREMLLLKLGDKANTVIQHNIAGAAFEIFSPAIINDDGEWIRNRLNIYFGKFSMPVMGKSGGGFDAEVVDAIYPPKGNKLTIYNVIIKLEGGKELIDEAVANIDFNAIIQLIAKQ